LNTKPAGSDYGKELTNSSLVTDIIYNTFKTEEIYIICRMTGTGFNLIIIYISISGMVNVWEIAIRNYQWSSSSFFL